MQKLQKDKPFKKRLTITTNISSDYKKTKQLQTDIKDYKETQLPKRDRK